MTQSVYETRNTENVDRNDFYPILKIDRKDILKMVDFNKDYPYAAYLDFENSPIIQLPEFGWFISGYDEVVTIMKDERFLTVPPIFQTEKSFKSRSAILRKSIGKLVLKLMNMNSFMKMSQKWMVFQDPPEHSKSRNIVQASFKPSIVKNIVPSIEKFTDQLIEEMIEKQKRGENIELINDFAYPLPILVITELLGIPGDKQEEFKKWSRMIIDGVNVNSARDIPAAIGASIGVKKSVKYIQSLINEKRNTGDIDDENLLNELIKQQMLDPEFTDDHIVANMLLMLIAGHETTVNMLSNTIYALAKNIDQYELLRENKDLASNALEEGLRYNPPITLLQRRAAEDMEILGVSMKEGDIVELSVHTANHDKEMFYSPHDFNIQRKNSRKHISFGKGIHYCMGAPLARKEGEIVLNKIADHSSRISVISAERKKLLRFSSFKTVYVKFE